MISGHLYYVAGQDLGPPTLVKSVKALFFKNIIRNVEFKYSYLKQFQMIQLLF